MADFPDLSRPPARDGFEEDPQDLTLRAPTESGYEFTRARSPRVRNEWVIKYELMTQADKDAMVAFVALVNVGAGSFNWNHPTELLTKVVRFSEAPKYRYVGFATGGHTWEITFKVKEV